jgi:hypothetical protein
MGRDFERAKNMIIRDKFDEGKISIVVQRIGELRVTSCHDRDTCESKKGD